MTPLVIGFTFIEEGVIRIKGFYYTILGRPFAAEAGFYIYIPGLHPAEQHNLMRLCLIKP
jgi:hypothetical protein